MAHRPAEKALALTGVVLLSIVAAAGAGAGASTFRLVIVPGKSIGKVSLGETRTQLRADVGRPKKVLIYRGALGTRVERYVYRRFSADVADENMRVIHILSNDPSARTTSGAGVGVREFRIHQAFPAIRCFSQNTQRYCQIGNPNRPGSRITTFFLRGGTVRTAVVALAVNT